MFMNKCGWGTDWQIGDICQILAALSVEKMWEIKLAKIKIERNCKTY